MPDERQRHNKQYGGEEDAVPAERRTAEQVCDEHNAGAGSSAGQRWTHDVPYRRVETEPAGERHECGKPEIDDASSGRERGEIQPERTYTSDRPMRGTNVTTPVSSPNRSGYGMDTSGGETRFSALYSTHANTMTEKIVSIWPKKIAPSSRSTFTKNR